jgi:peptidase inhibitor family I36
MSYCKLALAIAAALLSIGAAQAQQGTCATGYVWREAFSGDKVCVLPATRSQAAADNTQAASRRQPGGGAYGPDTCRQGYVWREARPSDHVCVTPETRSQAAADNREAQNRLASSAPSGKPPGGAEPRRTCTLYEHRDFAGAHYTLRNGDVMYMIRDPQPNVGTSDGIHRFIYEPSWNDKLSSFKVEGGCTLTLWEHVNRGGHHFTAIRDYSYVGDGWNDKASQADCSCPGLANF